MKGRTNCGVAATTHKYINPCAVLKIITLKNSVISVTNNIISQVLDDSFKIQESNSYDTYIYQIIPSEFGLWTITASYNDKICLKEILIQCTTTYFWKVPNQIYIENQSNIDNYESKKWPLNANYVSGTNAATLEVIQNNGYLQIGLTARDGASGGAIYKLPIDFSLYNKLVIEYQSSINAAQRTANLALQPNLTDEYVTTNRILNFELSSTSRTTATIDISNIETSGYIFLFRFRGDGNTASSLDYLYIYNMYLE